MLKRYSCAKQGYRFVFATVKVYLYTQLVTFIKAFYFALQYHKNTVK